MRKVVVVIVRRNKRRWTMKITDLVKRLKRQVLGKTIVRVHYEPAVYPVGCPVLYGVFASLECGAALLLPCISRFEKVAASLTRNVAQDLSANTITDVFAIEDGDDRGIWVEVADPHVAVRVSSVIPASGKKTQLQKAMAESSLTVLSVVDHGTQQV
jgi:hypothetical protein